jgi:hypothetical protein
MHSSTIRSLFLKITTKKVVLY